MKRCDINQILGHTGQFFSMHHEHLPPFSSFPPTKLQQIEQAAWEEGVSYTHVRAHETI
ncbi:D-lyxose/D-mannose family sugar isomerase, partial [Enterobacter intestinihominis]